MLDLCHLVMFATVCFHIYCTPCAIHASVLMQALESNFNHESLSKAIGINPAKWYLMRYLQDRFIYLIGPICHQKKADASAEKKHFVPIDPMEQPKVDLGVCS